MSDIPTIASKLNSAGVEWEQAQVHAEVITTVLNGAFEQIATKEFVNSKVAELRAENAELRVDIAELHAKIETGNAELHAKIETGNAELHAKIETGNAELHAKIETGNAELRAENAELRVDIAELHAKIETGNAELRVEFKSSQLRQLRWIVGTIVAIGALQIASQLFT